MPTPLVVIDVQDPFLESIHDDIKPVLIRAIQRQIKLAKKRKAPIIFVELNVNMNGNTVPSVKQLTDNYDQTFVCYKTGADGSQSIMELVKRKKLRNIKRFRVCGVYSTACVAATVSGLLRRRKGVEIEPHATATSWNDDHSRQIKEWNQQSGVHLVK